MRAGTSRHRRAPHTDQRGAAAIEFAFIVPFLLLLTYGIISYGYMLSFRQSMSQGAAEGARAAAVAPVSLTTAQVQQRARDAINDGLGNYGVACNGSAQLIHGGKVVGSCTVSARQTCTSTTPNAQCVKVTLTYNYRANPLVPSMPGVGVVLPPALTVITEEQVNQ